ncbi:aliphatic sulfonate ABC transporter substrate-binding protein [Paracoccus shanxieyensis]|uniref:Putative aliphatic sulfonates-binding protein n=1 Tax=Paracoccus shanxieyensis TaxID=2675752 RepID=A0A6L6J139_9RHOB|nr:aliphatic sulfonate ABC transporter substrate-binding protein [Paracoccus shanxieyensis]MTH65538.1 aliphatic sulfonate ABC transporter substrate-binding protein [Paracoccus shanxieyensis]MTH88666.1 aliphatic sulfonate ABC transporter substrate-binding protein [Paracoccus shanxieyensis]
MTTTISRRHALALGLGMAALAAPGILRAAPAKALRVGWQKGGLLGLVKGSGAFEQALADKGIRVSWSEFTSGPPLLEALSANALDFGYTGNVPPIFAHAARGNLVFVGAGQGSREGHAILVPKDSPIQTIADLKGQTVAFKRGSSAHYATIKLLRTAGLTLDDIKPQDLAPPDAIAAFDAGAIGAWTIWDPYFAAAQERPNTRVLSTTEQLEPEFNFYSANGNYAKDNPELIATLVDTVKAVGQQGQADLPTTIATLSKATGLPESVMQRFLTRKGSDLGLVGFIEPKHIAYEQGVADEFFKLKIIPRQLDIASVVWTPQTAS